MSYAFQMYERIKQNVLTQLVQLRELADELQSTSASEQVMELFTTLEREQFEIMVVGEFNNGKSTFVNALLGREVLPAAVRPTTAILNKIYYNEEPQYRIHFRDTMKPPMVLTESQFRNIVAPEDVWENDPLKVETIKRNISLIQEIDHAEIGQSLDICKHGVVLVDSPGTNDLDPGREAITNYYIPKCDAAIIVFNAQRALSESEMSFIQHRILASDVRKLFFILNFKDLLNEVELQRVKDYVTNRLSKVVVEPRVFAISSRHALLNRSPQSVPAGTGRRRRQILPLEETGILEFESALMHFLEFERGPVKLEKPIYRGIKTAEGLLERYVEFERSTLNSNIKDMQEKVEGLTKQLEDVSRKGKESVVGFDLKLQQQGRELSRWYEKELDIIAKQAQRAVEVRYYKGCDIEKVKRNVEDQIAPMETELGQNLQRKVEEMIGESIEGESKPIVEGLQEIQKKWSADFSSLSFNPFFFGPLQTAELVRFILGAGPIAILIAKVAIIGLIVGSVFQFFKGIASSISDWFTGRDSKKEQLLEEIKQRFEAPIRERVLKLREHWNGIIPVVKDKYDAQVQHMINDTSAQLQVMIQNNQMSELEMAQALLKLENREKRLVRIMDELRSNQLRAEVAYERI